ncbi:MAG: RNA-guided pseudouridylation complex pseudouridine synthase subunit Cbf5 [Candidatus Hydrothermarchaeales archaeon]
MPKLPLEVERKLIVKSRSAADPKFGKKPEERSIEEHLKYGVINLDKPSGPTSHEVVSWVKNILGVGIAGHGGTLDPKVTGVLPIGLEESTKVVQVLLPSRKEYACVMRVHDDISDKRIKKVSEEFIGEIIQRPPVRSAVKRELRKRRIYYLDIFEVDGRDVLFKVGCEAGTYIRKLCHDIGEALGCGAHMVELRRTKSGAFTEDNLVTLHDVTDAYHFWKENGIEGPIREVVMPVERAVDYLPKIVIRDSAVDAICHGADLAVPGISKLDSKIEKGSLVAIFTLKDELVAIGRALMETKDILINDSGIVVNTTRVIMKPDTYPRMWKTGA